jgi:flagellar biosynthetic protein FliQ
VTGDSALADLHAALQVALMLAAPGLIAALVVGTLVSILQAVTQVQENTLVFVPKIVGVFGALAVAAGWMLDVAVRYGRGVFESIASVR